MAWKRESKNPWPILLKRRIFAWEPHEQGFFLVGLPFCPAEFAKEFGAFFVMSAGGGGFGNLGGKNFHSVSEAPV